MTVSPSADVSARLETVSGRLVNPTDPQSTEICLEDIAWGLSRIPRFAGHTITEVPYNVAQHSVYVSTLVERALNSDGAFAELEDWSTLQERLGRVRLVDGWAMASLYALLHDSHETYLGDIPSPIKRIPELQETFKLLELGFDHAIRSHFGLDEPADDVRVIVRYFDKLAQAIEGYQFMRSRGVNWALPVPTLTLLQKFPAPLTAFQSYKAFLERYEYLRDQ